MKRSVFILIAVSLALLGLFAAGPVGATTWDLSAQWSNTGSNPHGAWSYGEPDPWNLTQLTVPFNTMIMWGPDADFPNCDSTIKQPIWARNSTDWYNGLYKSILGVDGINPACAHDFPVGRVGGHSNTGFTWTAPVSGTINITGGCWRFRENLGRNMAISLAVNAWPIIDGSPLPSRSTGVTSVAPFSFDEMVLMAGGDPASLRNIPVSAGDVITFYNAWGSGGDFVGVDFTITTDTVPLPLPGTVNGVVKDSVTALPVEGAVVKITASNGSIQTFTTLANGAYSFSNVVAGNCTLNVTKGGYYSSTASLFARPGRTTTKDPAIIKIVATVDYWDLAADWSDVSNPNPTAEIPTWTYGTPSPLYWNTVNPLYSSWAVWGPNPDFPHAAQGGWLHGANWWDGLYKCIAATDGSGGGASAYDLPVGKVCGHGSTGFIWTAPKDLTNVSLSGGFWQIRHLNRSTPISVVITRSGVPTFLVQNLELAGNSATSAAPYTLAQAVAAQGGTPDAMLKNLTLSAGDTVAVRNSGADFVAFDFTVAAGNLPPGAIQGVITDATSSEPISGANVSIAGVTGSVVTGADGSYYLENISPGAQTVCVLKDGYIAQSIDVTIPTSDILTRNASLTPYIGLDIARYALATSSTGVARNLNDANAKTGWFDSSLGTSGLSSGNSIQLEWQNAMTISGILVDSAGPNPDYTVKSSNDGTTWTDVRHVTSTVSGRTHWMEKIDLVSPITVKYLNVLINSTNSNSTIWSVECFRPTGTVAGLVTDSLGAPISGASVYVNECIDGARGFSRLVVAGTTAGDGTYSLAVPEGPVMVTAGTGDSILSSMPNLAVTVGSTTTAPTIAVTRTASGVPFSDNFDDNHPELRWDNQVGAWASDGAGGFIPTVAGWNIATPKNVSLFDCVVEADIIGRECQLIARYKDDKNMVFLNNANNGQIYFHEVHDNQWPMGTPTEDTVDESVPHHMRLVCVGNVAQGYISDGYNTYWTEPYQLNYILSAGKVGVTVTALQGQKVDNLVVTNGSGAQEPLTLSDLKSVAPGWYGCVKAIVSGVFADYNMFYLEDSGRTVGIKVAPLDGRPLVIGEEITVNGVKQADGSLRLLNVTPTGNSVNLGTLGVTNKSLIGATGLSNENLLVKTWGTIIDDPYTAPDGTQTFHINDGSSSSTAQALVAGGTGGLVFDDNFDAGTKGAAWIDAMGATTVESGKLVSPGPTNEIVVGEVSMLEPTVSVDIDASVAAGILVRFADANSFVLGFYSPVNNTIAFHEKVNGNWGGWLDPVWNAAFTKTGTIRMTLQVVGNQATLTVSDGTNSVSSTTPLATLHSAGLVGLYHDTGNTWIQNFDNFTIQTTDAVHSVPVDVIKVIVPPSVTGTPSIAKGDHVSVAGIAGKGSVLRHVTVRKVEDLTTN